MKKYPVLPSEDVQAQQNFFLRRLSVIKRHDLGVDKCKDPAGKAFDIIAGLEEELTRVREAQTWKPIETALKEKALLLGFFNEAGKWRTVKGEFFTQAEIDSEWEDECEEGWYEISEISDENISAWRFSPTHWMRLPAALSTSDGGKE